MKNEDAERQKFPQKFTGTLCVFVSLVYTDSICLIVSLHRTNSSVRPFQELPLASGASEWAITLSILERNHMHAPHTHTDTFD